MISWIQKYFQRHFRLVFIAVLLAVGLPMVVIYSSSGSGGGGTTKLLERPFFGINLANQEQARRMMVDGELSAQLRMDYTAMQNLEQYALRRVAGLALADEFHLPKASPEEVDKFIPTLPAFFNPQGQFDHTVYARFGDSIKSAGSPFTAADVNRVLRDDVRLLAVAKVLGGPGYVLPADVKKQLSRVDSVWTVQVASLDYASFNPAINLTDEALKKFHTENSFRYDVPARPRLAYVEYKATDFVPPGAPTEDELRAFYNANPARFPVPADAEKKDAALPATATDNFAKVRGEVETTLRDLASRRAALQVATDLQAALYDRRATIKAASPELTAFLASQRLTAVPIPPYALNGPPPVDRLWLGAHTQIISRLSADRYFSDPVPTREGIAVLLWQETLPAYQPLFPEVRDRVIADYREQEKQRLFNERGNALKAQLQAAAKTPAGFAEKAASEKLEVKSYANFTLRQPPQDLPQPALATLIRLESGQVSDMIGLGDKGLLVYAQEKKVPDLTAANPRYAEIQTQVMAFLASNNENSVLADLVAEERKKTETLPTP